MKNEKRASAWQEIFKPTLMLCLILAVTVGLLAATRQLTEKPGEKGEYLFEEALYRQIYDADSFEKVDGYTEEEVLEVLSAGEGRYLITVAEKGYSATKLQIVVGVSRPNVADRVAFGVCDETQGLGANIQKEKFTSKTIGKEGPFELGKNVDGLAGATYSSKAYYRALNVAFAVYDRLEGGANQ